MAMAEELEERARRIVETAIELAEQGGFEAVRLRDVAAHAGVALGTLYRRFRSKEDLLIAALELETRSLERRFSQKKPAGEDELERVMGFFTLATKGLLRRPNLARALLRAVASGEPALARKVGAYHAHVTRMIVMSLRGELSCSDGELTDPTLPVTERERELANSLDLMWFALLVGWSGGIHKQADVLERMRSSARLVIRGSWEIQ
jgi:AcrR family transcriptional regulator